MIGICTGSGWRDEALFLELRGGANKLLPLRVGDEIAWSIRHPRMCIGYRGPTSVSLQPCPEEAKNITTSQCDACFERAAVLPCLRCDGERCRNPERRGSCVRPRNHALYLASFGPGIVKVGVARWGRRRERILEQGSRAALVVARDDGQMIRRAETAIKKIGIPDRISPSIKIGAMPIAASRADLEDEVKQKLAEIKGRVRAEWVDPESVSLPEFAPLSHRPQLQSPGVGWVLRGQIESVLGSSVICRTDRGDLAVVESGALHGYLLDTPSAEEESVGQTSLALSA